MQNLRRYQSLSPVAGTRDALRYVGQQRHYVLLAREDALHADNVVAVKGSAKRLRGGPRMAGHKNRGAFLKYIDYGEEQACVAAPAHAVHRFEYLISSCQH